MLANYTVSVVIAAYNVQDYIEDCLDSLWGNEEYIDKVQVIIVNDGSTDNTADIIRQKYQKSNLLLIDKANGGQSSARNVGINHAEGKYLIFLDADDKVDHKLFEKTINAIEKNNVDMVCFDASEFYTDLDEIPYKVNTYCRPSDVYDRRVNADTYFDYCINNRMYNVSPCMYLLKRELILNLSFKEGVIYEDNLFTTKVLLFSDIKSIFCLQDKLYKRRLRADSTVTEKKGENHFKSYLCVYDELCLLSTLPHTSAKYDTFCGNILALTAKVIGNIDTLTFKERSSFKMLILSRIIKNPKTFRTRVLFALFFGQLYSKAAYFIKLRTQ